MNYRQFNIALPIKDNNVQMIDGIVQGDTANTVNVRLMDGAEPFDFTGYNQVFIEISKPDGNAVQACVTSDPDIEDANNPYNIQIVDAKQGRIAFTLKGQATVLPGTHFGQIVIIGAGQKITTARFNYYSGDSLFEEMPEISSSNDYASLMALYMSLSKIASEEDNRAEAEIQREEAEADREQRIIELTNEITEYLRNADSYVESSREYMELAERFAELAQNPSKELLNELLQELDFATATAMEEAVRSATRDFDAGNYTDGESVCKKLRARRGAHADIPTLDSGEFGWSEDSKTLYVGTGSSNIPINGVYIVSWDAPERTDIFWIDTSSGGVIKFYNGSSWQPTATAVFS